MQSMTLWLVSKHDTFQHHVDAQAALEAAAPSRARRRTEPARGVCYYRWQELSGLVLLMENHGAQLATWWLPTGAGNVKEDA